MYSIIRKLLKSEPPVIGRTDARRFAVLPTARAISQKPRPEYLRPLVLASEIGFKVERMMRKQLVGI